MSSKRFPAQEDLYETGGRGAQLAPAMSHETPALDAVGLSLTFPDGTDAFQDVTFAVHPGEFVTIVGPSGCGKSTLLRAAAGLLAPTAGTVKRTSDSVGFVFQEPTLLPWRTVRGNTELLLELRGADKETRAREAGAALSLVNLTEFEKHLPRQLSGGMRMRASLARWLTLHPALFLFDEPFAALDEHTRQRLNRELSELFIREAFAGLFITHSIYEAVFLSTRVCVMSPRPGRIISVFDVPFAYPRSDELRFDSDYIKLCHEVAEALRWTT